MTSEAGSQQGEPEERPLQRSTTDMERTGQQFELAKADFRAQDLPIESLQLDFHLYNVLKQLIKGSKALLLRNVKLPMYTQAIAVLWNHMDISRSDRKMRAFQDMEKVMLKGDVKRWHIETVSAITELLDTK